jgi:hypothetical protein
VFVLDTDHLTFLERGKSIEAERLKARLKQSHAVKLGLFSP